MEEYCKSSYRYLEGVNGHLVFHGVQRSSSNIVGRVADRIGLGRPAESHLS